MIATVVSAAAVVLAIAGVAKMSRPDPAVGALRQADLPGSATLVVAMGVGELVVGVAVVIWRTSFGIALLGIAYLGFAWFAARLLRRRGRSVSCGCFGVADAPVHPVHVVIDTLVATVAFVGTVQSPYGAPAPWTVVIGVVVLLAGLVAVPKFSTT